MSKNKSNTIHAVICKTRQGTGGTVLTLNLAHVINSSDRFKMSGSTYVHDVDTSQDDSPKLARNIVVKDGIGSLNAPVETNAAKIPNDAMLVLHDLDGATPRETILKRIKKPNTVAIVLISPVNLTDDMKLFKYLQSKDDVSALGLLVSGQEDNPQILEELSQQLLLFRGGEFGDVFDSYLGFHSVFKELSDNGAGAGTLTGIRSQDQRHLQMNLEDIAREIETIFF